MNVYHPDALRLLRNEMKKAGIDYYLMTSSDCHASEYVSDYFKVTEFVSGCTSDNVLLIVGEKDAWLWTDGRYFISGAAELAKSAELSGSPIQLMKEGEPEVPKAEDFLAELLSGRGADGEGAAASGSIRNRTSEPCGITPGCKEYHKRITFGFDGRQVSAKDGMRYRETAAKAGADCIGSADLFEKIWPVGTDASLEAGSGENSSSVISENTPKRPLLPSHPVMILPEEICGQTCEEKIHDIREDLKKEGARSLFLSKLDDIMWLLNIRGKDVPYNPVALSYALLTEEALYLFIQNSEVTEELRMYAAAHGIMLRPYQDVIPFLKEQELSGPVLCDSSATNDAVWQLLSEKTELLDRQNPTEIRKACKNPVEMDQIRKFYLLDSVALCRFIFYIKKNAGKQPMTEMEAARKLDMLRAEIPGFLDLSFPTIPAVGANAAMAHYAAEGDGDPVGSEGFLLVDSGGQYLGATTDVTRTIVLGSLSDQMKRDFTLVAAAHFRLLHAVFKKGTGGYQLDMLAREPLYAHGLDYNHGTGHGIGYILNVHEGPQRIGSLRKGAPDVPLQEGMLTSDEPGVYREGAYGIRTESITLTVPHSETEFGKFLQFECLTFAPIDLDGIDTSYLNDEDLRNLNEYHDAVWNHISPYLKGEERDWLREATRPLSR